MRRLALLALAILGGTAAAAQTVPVRGGEHDGFTRLVLAMPEVGDWALLPAPGGYEVRLDGAQGFDLSRTFQRIPRDRVAMLGVRGPGRLGLDLGCDCHAVASVYPGLGLVVDVRDGPAPPDAVAPGARGPAPAERPPVLPLLLAPAPVPSLLLPFAGSGDAMEEEERLAAADRVSRTERAMLEGVAAAASRGLLDLAPGGGVQLPSGGGAGPAQGDGRPGIAFRTGSEIDPLAAGPLAADGTACRPDGDFDLAAWAGSGDFGAEIGPRMAALSDARDRLDPEAAEALARTYLAFGFGREAAMALGLDGRSSRERDGLRDLARILDGDEVPAAAFADQAGCLGAVALWRALARGTLEGTGERERIAATIALRALPDSVRDALSIRLAGLFLQAGDPGGADELARMSDGQGPEAALARVEITREVEGPQPALAELSELAETSPRLTPEAMAALLDLSVAEGQPVAEERFELARALRFENPGPPARTLLLAEARALTAARRYQDALDLLAGERAERPGEDVDAALTGTVASLTEELEDAPFLELVLDRLPPGLPPTARETAAQRLAALGFPDEAQRLRGRSPDLPALDPAEATRAPEPDATFPIAVEPVSALVPLADLPALLDAELTPVSNQIPPAAPPAIGSPPVLEATASETPAPMTGSTPETEAVPPIPVVPPMAAVAGLPPEGGPEEIGPAAATSVPAATEPVVPIFADGTPALPVTPVLPPEPAPAAADASPVATAAAPEPAAPDPAPAEAVALAAPLPTPPLDTLAERRELLTRAAEARERAAALLAQPIGP